MRAQERRRDRVGTGKGHNEGPGTDRGALSWRVRRIPLTLCTCISLSVSLSVTASVCRVRLSLFLYVSIAPIKATVRDSKLLVGAVPVRRVHCIKSKHIIWGGSQTDAGT